jgi:hypothetical protein
MKKEVKIILFPEEHKSKNGTFFENLIRTLFSNEYDIDQNINFTGLEIDILGKNKRRDETLIIECKAKQKPRSEEIKNFAYNVLISKKVDFGYFLHTEELDHQAGGVVKELLENQEHKKKVSFLGPKQIIEILVEKNIVKPIEQIELTDGLLPYKCSLAYTYFGLFYVLIASETTNTNEFYLFNAKTLEEIKNISMIASEEHSSNLTIDKVLRTSIIEIKNKSHKYLGVQDVQTINAPNFDTIQTYAEISEEFIKNLNSPGVVFSHSNINEISISDIFVPPDLKYISAEKDTQNQVYKNLIDVADAEYKDGIKYVMLGEDCSGRTTICKYLFQRYYSQGYLPILLHASEINNLRTDAIEKLVSRIFKNQYNTSYTSASYPKEKILLIVDDFHKIPNKNREFWGILVKNINEAFRNVIITGSTLMPLESVADRKNRTRQNVFQEYDIYVISELGHKLRTKLIDKWNTLGSEENLIDKNELFRKNDNAFQYVQSIIGNNYVPAFPFYILTILQALESGNSHNPNYSLHGFYYELIINDALARAVKDKKEISLYYNYLTYFCYYLFEQKIKQIFITDFKEFHKGYCQKFDIDYSSERILSSLNNAKLILVNNEISVPYKYVYYFFVAKYLTNNINKPEIKETISKICQRTYRDEYASIIMFLSHLSKDEFIIDTLLQNAKNIFSEYQIAQLGSDISGINDLVKELPKQIIQQISAEDAREEEIEDKDELERLEKDFEQQSQEEQEFDLNEDIDTIGIFAKINHSCNCLGQNFRYS